jgi:transcriptional regulator with PAS, ATPase and Fis domain
MHRDVLSPLVGDSPAMCVLRDHIHRVSQRPFAVLIAGETGTGKELVARHIHTASPKARGPFVAVNCSALVESLLEAELFGIDDRVATDVRGRSGRFEQAHGGTLFLDEVGELSPAAQAKLLRVLQDRVVERVGSQFRRCIDARIVAASNRDLRQLVAEGLFRADLFYRLNAIDLTVPPLRDRLGDVPALTGHILAQLGCSPDTCLSSDVLEALLLYPWPGNVRELERTLERAVALKTADQIQLTDLPRHILDQTRHVRAVSGGDQTLDAWCARYAHLVLARCHGNKSRACAQLDISHHTLVRYLRLSTPLPSVLDGGQLSSVN